MTQSLITIRHAKASPYSATYSNVFISQLAVPRYDGVTMLQVHYHIPQVVHASACSACGKQDKYLHCLPLRGSQWRR